jgi:hypothetical protein
MNFLRKVVTAIGSIFLAALLIAALAPKATRALAAALVQVTNTTSNPVPTSDVAPLQPFSGGCTKAFPTSNSNNGCEILLPSGKRLVGQTISMAAVVDPGVQVADAEFGPNAGGSTVIFIALPFTGSNGNDVHEVAQELRFYADDHLFCEASYNVATTVNDFSCSVSGYLVDKP